MPPLPSSRSSGSGQRWRVLQASEVGGHVIVEMGDRAGTWLSYRRSDSCTRRMGGGGAGAPAGALSAPAESGGVG